MVTAPELYAHAQLGCLLVGRPQQPPAALREPQRVTSPASSPLRLSHTLNLVLAREAGACVCGLASAENFLLSNKTDKAIVKATDFGLSVFYKKGAVFDEMACPSDPRARAHQPAGLACGLLLFPLVTLLHGCLSTASCLLSLRRKQTAR